MKLSFSWLFKKKNERKMSKVIVLLDVDGVLLAMGQQPENTLKVGKMVYDANLPAWLQKLSQIAEIYWCSSWQDQSDQFAHDLGFSSAGYIGFSELKRTKNYFWGKLEAIEHFMIEHQNQSFVLIDDNANSWLIEESSLLTDLQKNGRLLVIKPFAYTGISEDEMNKVTNYVDHINKSQ